jgi:peptidoglycan/LPS O-acetylase OafA/YrhL
MASVATLPVPVDTQPPAREGVPFGGRMPSLDGLRAVSIILVLVSHLSGTRGIGRFDLGIGDYGHLGVVVFFVISGFLITRLLLSEHAQKGYISLKRFYLRRVLRLFPAAYALIACATILWLAGMLPIKPGDLWHAATYTMNYYPQRYWDLGHLWSLSVEEQFYLLWPFAFLMLGPRWAPWVAAAAILCGPLARGLNWHYLRNSLYYHAELFPMVADSLATGCLLAKVSGWLERQSWYLNLFHPVCSLGLVALILLANRNMRNIWVVIVGTSVINICIGILVHRSVYCFRDWAGRLLNWRPVAFIGVLSYSLYVWQQLFLNPNSHAWVNAFPQNLVLAFAAALGSYLLLEKPFFRLRHHLRA